MSYPLKMFLEHMAWALKNLQRCYLDPATPLQTFRKWESIFDHFYKELKKYVHAHGELPE